MYTLPKLCRRRVKIPWHTRGANNSDFPKAAFRFGRRIALAYDANLALIAGIEDNPTR